MLKKSLILYTTLCFCLVLPLSSRPRQTYISPQELTQLENDGFLIKIETNTWKTKGGLLFKGKDPKGLTRLEHIMKHTKNQPKRKKHGVFTISKKEIIVLLDKIWLQIKQKKLRGNTRGNKVVYTYKTRTSIGYLGGKAGKKAGQPQLTRARLVLIKNSPQVVTFFPY